MAAPQSEANVLLFLGAGASAPSPANLPAFLALTNQLLDQLDWHANSSPKRYAHSRYPEIRPPTDGEPAPEVVFRTLHRLTIPFAQPVASAFSDVKANAVHHAAANLLRTGGSVWTTNFDLGVEVACGGDLRVALNQPPPGRAYLPLRSANQGVLVKFHGTAAEPATMAFTDWELVTPIDDAVAVRLIEAARGAHMVFYGYRGADPDLADMLSAAMANASQVTWLVADSGTRDGVIAAFPRAPIAFRPEVGLDADFGACARALLEVLEPYGLLEGVDTVGLFARPDPVTVDFGIERPPEIVHAELVERFGMPDDRHRAYRDAFVRDLLRPFRLRRVWRRYGRQALASSLYDGWFVSGGIRLSVGLSRYRPIQVLANLPVLRRYRDLVLDKGPALLLRGGEWREMRRLTEHAFAVRSTKDGLLPDDLYYHGHALRYAGEVRAAREDQERAEPGFAGHAGRPVDPERLAGTILEQGILDLYAGRFDDALHRGWDLRERRGRFAIRRWRAWGFWLSGTASVFRLNLNMAGDHLLQAAEYFTTVEEQSHLGDVRSAQLLQARVAMALGVPSELPDDVDERHLSTRQRDDLRLVKADIAIAEGDFALAARLAGRVAGEPSNVMAELWAQLVLGELERRDDSGTERLVSVREKAQGLGARWLELQALRALARTGSADTAAIESLEADMQLPSLGLLGDPPPLWSLT